MTPKASSSGFFSALDGDDTEDEAPRRRKLNKKPTPEEQPTPPAHTPEEHPTPPTPPTPPRKRRREPVHKVSVDVYLNLLDGLEELYARDGTGPKAEINEAIRSHLKARGITINPSEG